MLHVVWTGDGVELVPKSSPSFERTFVDLDEVLARMNASRSGTSSEDPDFEALVENLRRSGLIRVVPVRLAQAVDATPAPEVRRPQDGRESQPAPPAPREPEATSKRPPAGDGFPTLRGMGLDMTPTEVSLAAREVNSDVSLPPGAVLGFWSTDRSVAPRPSLAPDATGAWHFGYSIPPRPASAARRSDALEEAARQEPLMDTMLDIMQPGRKDASLWTRVGWVFVSFDGRHRAESISLKMRPHFGPDGPMAIPPNNLQPAEIAQRLSDTLEVPKFVPNRTGTGWEYADRDDGWKLEFACKHWSVESARSGATPEFLTFDDERLREFRQAAEFGRAAGGLAALGGDSEALAVAYVASRLDTAWVATISRTSRTKDLKLK